MSKKLDFRLARRARAVKHYICDDEPATTSQQARLCSEKAGDGDAHRLWKVAEHEAPEPPHQCEAAAVVRALPIEGPIMKLGHPADRIACEIQWAMLGLENKSCLASTRFPNGFANNPPCKHKLTETPE